MKIDPNLILLVISSNEPVSPAGRTLGIILAAILFALLFLVFPIMLISEWLGMVPARKIRARYRMYLGEFPIYNQLNPKEKVRFEKRVQTFINQKKFIPRSKGLVIDDRKKCMIAGTAVELTFGLGKFNFDHFKTILIYSDNYYSQISKQYHQGEVNIRGLIVLSWSNFEKGNSDRRDGVNLGVHEIAHALKLENKIVNRNYNFIDSRDYRAFEECFQTFSSGYGGGQGFLRDYGKTNIHEFFAVCCENFIERPREFKRKAPDIYMIITRILNQDPATYH